MLLILFLASSLFANSDYYAITAGSLFETYDVCYVELNYDNDVPELSKVSCSDYFTVLQSYYKDKNELLVSWRFEKQVNVSYEKNMRYGEQVTVDETYNLADEDTCFLRVGENYSWLINSNLFGCGMRKIVTH